MGSRAAVFDLDRTLLRGASGPAFATASAALGLPGIRVPGLELLFRCYEIAGESLVVMGAAKSAARRARGLETEHAAAVGEMAAPELLAKILPYVRPLLAEHRRAGDVLVMATTSPADLVRPLADRLGFDALIATRYQAIDGRYTGKIDGDLVWGRGKLRAVQRWARDEGVDLASSAAYSDSVFDYPLLSAVRRPVAVNPDPRLAVLAAARRWPIRYLDAPPGVVKVGGIEPFDVVRWMMRPELIPFAAFSFEGTEHVPPRGPAIVAANHRSYFDPIAAGLAVARAGRNARFLGKKEVFDAPVIGQMAAAMGGIRVDRGSGSDQPLRAAAAALDAGEIVVIMPQGTIPRGDAFRDPILRGRTGVARLAKMTGAPVVPLGLWGTEVVWPRTSRVPDVRTVLTRPKVPVRFGAPLQLNGVDLRADTDRLMAEIMALLPMA